VSKGQVENEPFGEFFVGALAATPCLLMILSVVAGRAGDGGLTEIVSYQVLLA
jgi:hypothetical protein